MDRYKYILSLVLLSVFLVSGQQGCADGGDTAEVPALGLEMVFVNEAPPLSVSVGQEFPIYIDLLNKGGDFIGKGEAKLYLSGIGTNLEGVKASVVNERSLAKESVSADRLVFAEAAKFTFPIETLHTLPLALKSCYNYGTRTSATICISARNETELCEVGTEKLTPTSNSAAPLQITSIKEEIVGSKLRVLFKIENKLGGAVYLPDVDCDKLHARDIAESFKEDKVQLEIRTTESGFSCKLRATAAPHEPIDATAGVGDVGTIVCEKALAGREYSVAPFSIVMRYKYVDSALKAINIVP